MNQEEYERLFIETSSKLKAAKLAFEKADPKSRMLKLAEMTVLKDKLFELSAIPKQFSKDTYYKAKLPENEAQRLKALMKLKILDSPYEAVFESIARLASTTCATPIALISLLDADRQWFKANIGLEAVKETSRDLAFCGHAILQDEILEVNDATMDIRFAENPLVTGDPQIRFYAGASIELPMGEKIGTLCVIDRKASGLSDMQRSVLEGLADVIAKILVARNTSIKSFEQALQQS